MGAEQRAGNVGGGGRRRPRRPGERRVLAGRAAERAVGALAPAPRGQPRDGRARCAGCSGPGGTLKPEKVQEVYGDWLMELGKARSVNVPTSRSTRPRGPRSRRRWATPTSRRGALGAGIDKKAAAEGDKAAARRSTRGELRARHAVAVEGDDIDAGRDRPDPVPGAEDQLRHRCEGHGVAAADGGYSARYAVGGRTVRRSPSSADDGAEPASGPVRLGARRAHAGQAGPGGRRGGREVGNDVSRPSSSSAARCRPPTRPAAPVQEVRDGVPP